MICQNCLEEYRFEGFKYDWKNNRAFGNFVCGCEARLVLPEEDCISLGILDAEAREQLRHFRLMGLRRAVAKERGPSQVYLKALRAHRTTLTRYLADVSAKGWLVH